jgi:hypothetical protein
VEIGQAYNPRKLFYGVFVPEWLLRQPDISQGAKLCFAVLCRHAGEDGTCDRDGESLAAELGVHLRQVRTYIGELLSEALIESRRRGLGQTNVYRFLWHPWADAAACRETPSAPRQETQNRPRQKMQYAARQQMQDTAGPHVSQSTALEGRETRLEEPPPPSSEVPEQFDPEHVSTGRVFWKSQGDFEIRAVGCAGDYELRESFAVLGWCLSQNLDPKDGILEAGLADARKSTGRLSTVSPRALGVGLRKAATALLESRAKQDETARRLAEAAAEDERLRAEQEERRGWRREYDARMDRAALAGPGSPEWNAWLAERPGSPTQRDLVRMRRKTLLARDAASFAGAQ